MDVGDYNNRKGLLHCNAEHFLWEKDRKNGRYNFNINERCIIVILRKRS